MYRSRVKRGCFLGTKHLLVWQEHKRKLWNESAASAGMLLIAGDWERRILVIEVH